METAATEASPPSSKNRAGLRTAALWIAGCLMIVAGLLKLLLPGGWLNEQIGGLTTAAAGFCLLPPLLQGIRRKWAWTRPAWVPLVSFAFIVVAVPLALRPLEPSIAEQARERATVVAAAERLLAEGNFAGARLKLFAIQRRPDPEGRVADLLRRIGEAEDAARAALRRADAASSPAAQAGSANESPSSPAPADPADVYVERVQTYWMPQVEGLPSTPAAGERLGELLSRMDALRSYVTDGERLSLSRAQRAVHTRFSEALSAKQRLLFPAIRRRYAEELNAQLFRRDIAVAASGPRSQKLRFTGPIFVRNANIADMQTELTAVLATMRFRRVEYRWSRHAGGTTYYDLEPAADRHVSSVSS